jgi:hypothetical protein
MKAPSMKPPSWRKLIASSAALFLVIGAFLSGRVNAGTDPALQKSKTSNAAQTTQAKTPSTQSQSQTTTGSGYDTGSGSSGSSQSNPTTTQAS